VQKLESIGTLAGGIAHDFNNLLGGLLAGLELIELDASGRPDLLRDIPEMKALVQRGADLTRQLLGFARRGKYDARPVRVTDVVAPTCRLLGRTRKDLTLRLALAPEAAPVLADATQLEQVLLNLLLNAAAAMPGGGEIEVGTAYVDLSAELTTPHGARPGQYVRLWVTDHGIGMDADTRARIFEPFFTTREAGKGTGLGLASAFGIVQHHGGFITVESAPSRGSTFSVLLPTTERPVMDRHPVESRPLRGGETLLLVDDEEPVVRFGRRALESLGYEVLTARTGSEAVEIVRGSPGGIDVVILDMVMPGMNGAQTFAALRALVPSLKVLLASGYSLEHDAAEVLAPGNSGFIQKPFDLATLSAKLRSLL
jgi:CheY-like chemotaxis protein